MESKRLKDVYKIVKELTSGSQLQGELAMILSDDILVNLFTKNIFKALQSVVENLEDITDVGLRKIFYYFLKINVIIYINEI